MTTKYVIINDPTARNHAYMMSKWAIDIQYDRPKCGKDRVVTWLFPRPGYVICRRVSWSKSAF